MSLEFLFSLYSGFFLQSLWSLGNAGSSQLGSEVQETGILPSPGATLTISQGDMVRPSKKHHC